MFPSMNKFNQGQKRFYQEINERVRNGDVISDAEESNRFWSEIWSTEKEHNIDTKWMGNIWNELGNEKQRFGSNSKVDSNQIKKHTQLEGSWNRLSAISMNA